MMKDEWCYWMNAFTREECESIIQAAKKLPEQSATIGQNSLPADSGFRRSIIRWVDPVVNPEFTWVYDKLWNINRTVNHSWFGFNITHLPPLQFTEYDESYMGEYKSHQDTFWLAENHRKLSMVLQLSPESEYEGGSLVLENTTNNPSEGDMAAMRQQGTVIAFASFMFHRLTPVTRGKRYSLVAWFEGPPFQ